MDRKQLDKKRIQIRQESGEIMLESMIILTVTLMLMFAMLAMGFAYYEKAMLQIVANETASYVASEYKYINQDLDDFSITEDSINSLKMFRTSLAVGSMKKLNRERANAYILNRIQVTNFGINTTDPIIREDDFKIVVDAMGRLHVECTISLQTSVLFSGVLEFFGISDADMIYTATGRAEISDITAFASYVGYGNYLKTKIDGNAATIVTSLYGAIEDVKKIYDKLR